MTDENSSDKRYARRYKMETKVEFYVDADIIGAKSIDVSESGVRFRTDFPIKIRMRFEVDGEIKEREAQLVWADQSKDGMSYGFEFVPDSESYLFS